MNDVDDLLRESIGEFESIIVIGIDKDKNHVVSYLNLSKIEVLGVLSVTSYDLLSD